MKPGEFRKLKIDLPREPVTNEAPWLVAGLLLAFAFIMLAALAYFAR